MELIKELQEQKYDQYTLNNHVKVGNKTVVFFKNLWNLLTKISVRVNIGINRYEIFQFLITI